MKKPFVLLFILTLLILVLFWSKLIPVKQYGVFFTADNQKIATELPSKLDQLDLLMPVWLHLKNGSGDIQVADDKQLNSVMELLHNNLKKIQVIPVLSNHDGVQWQRAYVEALFNDPAKQDRLIANLSQFLKSKELTGINFDFEGFNEEMLPQYLAFLKRASVQLHAANLQIALCLSPHWKRIINNDLAESLDLIVPMIYDEHWAASPPGPIASQQWFEETFQRVIAKLPPGKLIIGLGNYAYDWPENAPGKDMAVQTALQTAKKNHARIRIDPSSNNPLFLYVDDQLIKHQVWLLDAYTLNNQVAFLKDYGIRGIILWQMGSEDPKIWEFYGKSPLQGNESLLNH